MMESRDTAVCKLIDEFVNHQINDKSIPAIAVCVVGHHDHDGEGIRVLHERIYHHKDIKTPVPSLDKTLFRVASVSKLFTYVGLLQLVDRGLISLMDPITKYVLDFCPTNPFVDIDAPDYDYGTIDSPDREYFKEINVFNLLRHTSGLIREPLDGNYFNFEQCDLIELVKSLNHSRLVIPPNKIAKYSNAAVALIGYIIEVVSGIVFEDFIEQNVLLPLGMKDSSFKNIHSNTDVKNESELRTAVGHMWRYWDETDTDLSVFTEAPHTHFGMNPAAGLRTTVNDISKFMQFLLNDGEPLLKKETFYQFITPQPLDHVVPPQMNHVYDKGAEHPGSVTRGLGIDISQFLGYKVIRHGGAINGFATDLRALPELNLSVFTCTTLDANNGISIMISEYITLLFMPSLVKEIHSPLLEKGRVKYLETVKEKVDFVQLTMKATELDDKMYDIVKGLYKKGKHLERYYPDSSLQKIYKEYNGHIYLRQNPFISKIKMVRSRDITYIITSDRLSCNQVLFIFYNEDLDSPDIFFDYLDLQGKDKDFSESDGSLFYKPFIFNSNNENVPPSNVNCNTNLVEDGGDQISNILPPMDYTCLEPQIAPYIKHILGVYEAKDQIALIFEENGLLHVCIEWLFIYKLDFYNITTDNNAKETIISFKFTPEAMYNYEILDFVVDSTNFSAKRIELSGIPFVYKYVGTSTKQVGVYDDQTCQKALATSLSIPVPFEQPVDHGLVDVGAMCDTIKVDLKYATSDNFTGITLYSGSATGRAYLHHEAATHLIKAHLWLVEHWGLGLVIFDSYRPWHVTWAMNECVEPQYRGKYVANPTRGSVHNRGGAVDISLYSISTGEVILMPGDYDEFSFRSHRSYFGGTTTQRYYRKLLTTALMSHQFSAYPQEWWHFDFISEKPLPVLNIPFDKLLK